MKKIIAVYGIAYLVLLMVVLGLQYVYPKPELHLLLNSYHTSLQDTFFKYYSMLAEWPLYILALLPILWKKIQMTIFFALCELSGGAVLQILKHLISTDGVSMHHSNSFPSGHASTFFVFCTCCALILAYHYSLKSKKEYHRNFFLITLSMLTLFVLATLGAYSRIYLSQHFLSDVCMGSIIGFVTPFLVFYFGRDKILKIKSKGEKVES